jgi:hypothetical protein
VIRPTVGRIVWFRPSGPNGPTLAAIVCGVNSDTSVNLHVLGMFGDSLGGHVSIHLKQEDSETPPAPYAEWMPYQLKQVERDATLFCAEVRKS